MLTLTQFKRSCSQSIAALFIHSSYKVGKEGIHFFFNKKVPCTFKSFYIPTPCTTLIKHHPLSFHSNFL